MGTQIDRVVEIVSMLTRAREEVARCEALLAGELGGGEPVADRRQVIAERVDGRRTRASGEVHKTIVEMAQQGHDRAAIAEKVGLGKQAVSDHLYRAKKADELPKAHGRK